MDSHILRVLTIRTDRRGRMPRGKYYPEELREEARRLRREGYSLNEIAARLGPPKNTLTLWVRGIELTPEQRQRLMRKKCKVLVVIAL